MENNVKKKLVREKRRVLRVRKNLRGTAEKPRLCVIKSNQNIYLQLIDDSQGKTLASTSTLAKGIKGTEQGKKNKDAAKALGMHIAKAALEINIGSAIFDRGASPYHGILAAVADGAREAGLNI